LAARGAADAPFPVPNVALGLLEGGKNQAELPVRGAGRSVASGWKR